MRCCNWKQASTALLLCVMSGYAATVMAGEPEPRAGTRPTQKNEAMRSGKVEAFLKNDHDDVDGMRLSDGSEVRFPPHLGDEISRVVSVGDRVEAAGRKETRPRGETVFAATRITSGGRTIEVENALRARPPVPRHRRGDEQPMNADGTVREFVRNDHGDTDGLLLSGGVEVKLPPHQGRELEKIVRVGDKVRVEGRRHVTPQGDVHLHADRITGVDSGRTIERDEPAGPKRGPRAEPAIAPRREAVAGPSNEEIMQELRALRRLVEDLK
jgi:hypothetical protein